MKFKDFGEQIDRENFGALDQKLLSSLNRIPGIDNSFDVLPPKIRDLFLRYFKKEFVVGSNFRVNFYEEVLKSRDQII